jgi:hypothetical protein
MGTWDPRTAEASHRESLFHTPAARDTLVDSLPYACRQHVLWRVYVFHPTLSTRRRGCGGDLCIACIMYEQSLQPSQQRLFRWHLAALQHVGCRGERRRRRLLVCMWATTSVCTTMTRAGVHDTCKRCNWPPTTPPETASHRAGQLQPLLGRAAYVLDEVKVEVVWCGVVCCVRSPTGLSVSWPLFAIGWPRGAPSGLSESCAHTARQHGREGCLQRLPLTTRSR